MPNKCTRQPTSPARRQLAALTPATRLHEAADAKISKHHRHRHSQQQMHVRFMVSGSLMQSTTHLPRATGSRHSKDPKENPRQFQPQLPRQLHERSPDRLAKPLPAALQSLSGQHHLRRLLRSLLPHPSRRRLRRNTRRARPVRSLPRARWVRCSGRIHRGHQRLSRRTSPKPQRTSKSNRIHTQSVAVPPASTKKPCPASTQLPSSFHSTTHRFSASRNQNKKEGVNR
jgi:hypothetical protein